MIAAVICLRYRVADFGRTPAPLNLPTAEASSTSVIVERADGILNAAEHLAAWPGPCTSRTLRLIASVVAHLHAALRSDVDDDRAVGRSIRHQAVD